MDDLISSQAALDALGERPVVWSDNDDYTLGERNQYDMDRLAIETVPSAQPEKQHGRIFQEIVVKYPSYNPYPERKGKPYFSIKYTENGQGFIGYGTYKPEVLSEYLKEYFMPPAQPGCEDAVSREAVLNEIHRYMEERDYTIGLLDDNVCGLPPVTPKQPGWIPCDVRTPKHVEESYWICTDTGYQCQCRWTNNVFGLGARDEWGWKLLDIPQYSKVVAWQPLPTPYREGRQDGEG